MVEGWRGIFRPGQEGPQPRCFASGQGPEAPRTEKTRQTDPAPTGIGSKPNAPSAGSAKCANSRRLRSVAPQIEPLAGMEMATIIEGIAERIGRVSYADLPQEAVHWAKAAI